MSWDPPDSVKGGLYLCHNYAIGILGTVLGVHVCMLQWDPQDMLP